ncbi:MAG: hypothetical protein A2314_09325 [Elusimicrobia bacterium RIFOXYB2_FULL_50_12]|nr:MAG: hypothetical protein A2314_09325 [Elusimicrobia bacterium RIFOXYB2_FULL_50_12]
MKKNGLTLLELLVAVTILATVSAVVYQSFRAIIRASRTVQERAWVNQNLRRAWREISCDLRCAFVSQSGDAMAFRGYARTHPGSESSRVEFVTWRRHGNLMGLVRVEYYVDADAATPERGLVRKVLGFPSPRTKPFEAELSVVAPLAQSLKLEYFDGKTWADEWAAGGTNQYAQYRNQLPLLVRITLKFDENETDPSHETISTVVPVFASDLPKTRKF